MKNNIKKWIVSVVLMAIIINVFGGVNNLVSAEEMEKENPIITTEPTETTEETKETKETEAMSEDEITQPVDKEETTKEQVISEPSEETKPEEEKTGTVIIQHIAGTNSEQEEIKGKVGESYEVQLKDFPGYKYFQGKTKGVFQEETEYIYIYYLEVERNVEILIQTEDNNNENNLRPENIELILSKNGKEVDKFTIDIQDDATSFTSKDKYPILDENGKNINYSIEIKGYPEEYITDISLNRYSGNLNWHIAAILADDTFDIKLVSTMNFMDPVERTVHLYRNGEEVEGSPVTFNGEWDELTFKDMKRFDENGKANKYTVKQDTVEGVSYLEHIGLYDAYIPTIIIEVASIPSENVVGNVVWKGGPEKKPEVNLQLIQKKVGHLEPELEGVVPVDEREVVEEVSLKSGETSYTWKNLNFLTVALEKLGYEIKLTEVPKGYTAEYSEDGLTVILTHDGSVEEETVNIEGDIFWKDEDNKNGKRPESVTVNLMANGKKVASETVTTPDKQEMEVEATTPETNKEKTRMFTPKASSKTKTVTNTWSYSFKDMPKEENGETIVYTISQNPVANYKTSFEGSNIINTYTEETTPETEETEVVIGGESSTKPSSQNKNKTDKKALPKTGQAALTGITLAGTALVALGGYTVFKKKK